MEDELITARVERGPPSSVRVLRKLVWLLVGLKCGENVEKMRLES